jgi:hypothetical protein
MYPYYSRKQGILITGWENLGDREFEIYICSRQGQGIFPLRHRLQAGSGARPASYPTRTCILSQGLMRSENEVYHSTLISAEVKNPWSYTPVRLHDLVLN